uniref:Uncharacterized protein n=1 Tax=viral metagenome TaxID=1070528 RepID=A0A6M3IIM6_9ZZZZ
MALALGALVGQGMVFDTTNKYPFLGYGEISINFDTNEIEIPKGNWSNQMVYHSLLGGIGGTVSWHYSDANLIAALTGGTATASSGISVAKEEAGTVPATSTYTVTLTNSTTCIDGSIGHGSIYTGTGSSKAYFEIVAGGSEATGKCSVSSGVLTFAVGDASTAIRTTYLYTNATGTYVTVAPDDTPASWAGYLVLERVLETNAIGRLTIYGADIVWTGGFRLGATRAGHEAISRDFRVNNDASGDVLLYFD